MTWFGRDLKEHLAPAPHHEEGWHCDGWCTRFPLPAAELCGGSDTSPPCTANTEITAAQADRVSKDPCCHGPHQSLRLISLLPRVYVVPKGKRAARKASAFEKTKDLSGLLWFSLFPFSFFLFLWLYRLAPLYSGAQWFNVLSLMAIQTSYFRSYTTILLLYLWNGQKGGKKKQRLIIRRLFRNIVPNCTPALNELNGTVKKRKGSIWKSQFSNELSRPTLFSPNWNAASAAFFIELPLAFKILPTHRLTCGFYININICCTSLL